MKNSIYFPDILDGSTMLGNNMDTTSFYKDIIQSDDENILFKTKMMIGINKVIELANLFDCVYLDKIEFIHVIKDMFLNYPLICLDLLNNGRIRYIDNDKYYMFYNISKETPTIQIHGVPKTSDSKMFEEMTSGVDDNNYKKALEKALLLALKPSESLDGEVVTNQYYKDLQRGFYQGLSVGANGFITINPSNKELYDLIAEKTLNSYLCDLYKIPNIYLKEFFYWVDNHRCKFLNSIYPTRTLFTKEIVRNYCYSLQLNEDKYHYTNEALQKDSLKENKELHISVYPSGEFKYLTKAYCSNTNDDYKNMNFVFVDKDNKEIPLVRNSFDEYMKGLEERGVALRQTKLMIKITKKKYLKQFLSGDLKFSKPIDFINGQDGQNDRFEGTFKNSDVDGKRVALRNVYDLEYTLIWCCFGLDNYMFSDCLHKGKKTKKAVVKAEYYKGFIKEKDKEKYTKLLDEDKSAIIFIKPDVFVNRLYNSLIKKGVNAQDIIISPIIYVAKGECFHLSCEPPFELFYKDFSYLPQNEIRVLIRNSANKYDYLFDKYGVINIGDISDICTVIDGMYFKDMDCYLISDSKMEFVLPDTK